MKLSAKWTANLLLAGCGTVGQYKPPLPPPPSERVDQVWRWMGGTFSSSMQAMSDANDPPMTLHMQPIWKDRTDGRWLYVEKAPSKSPGQPLQQSVYQLVDRDNGDVEIRLYEFPSDPDVYTGAWKHQNPLDRFLPSQLVPRSGCGIRLKASSGNQWRGSTTGQNCACSKGGATYATCEVSLSAEEFDVWERGFDDAGKQIWGPTKGPDQFKRQP
ncbi:MAG: chromophore lyase CpcT/CpeT [Planctomycetes bacterium]|nr:chromophore lyase CpcT/CpeT [Planctomycetota bacterium]